MIRKIAIPKVDANMEEATIGRWLKREGEPVRRGEPLVELITDKAVFEYESPASGILRKIVAPPKSVLPVRYVIALVGDATGPLPEVDEGNRRLIRDRLAGGPDGSGEGAAAAKGPDAPGRVRATPAARRLAREIGVDIGAVRAKSGCEPVTEEMVRSFSGGGAAG